MQVLKQVVLTHLLGLSEAGPQQRQEDAGDGHVVSWLSDARVFSTGKHRHAPGDVPHRHLVTLQNGKQPREVSITPTAGCEAKTLRSYVFLDAQLLELHKLGASGLQVESASRLVGDALLAGTHDEGHEGGRLDLWTTSSSEKMPMCAQLVLFQKKNKNKIKPKTKNKKQNPHCTGW